MKTTSLLSVSRRVVLPVNDDSAFSVIPPLDASLADKTIIFSALPLSTDFARTYRTNMRHWAQVWRRAHRRGNRQLASIALFNAVVNNRWAKEAR